MRPQPLKPKKSKFIYTAVLCSLLLHLGLVAAPLMRPAAPEPEALKPVSLTLNEYQLAPSQAAEPVTAPSPSQPTPPKPKPAIMSKPKQPVQPDEAAEPEPAQTIASDDTPAVDAEKETEVEPAPNHDLATDEPASQPDTTETEADASLSATDEAQANTTADTAADQATSPEPEATANDKASPGPKLTEKDIANNGNLIQPKAGTQPSFPNNAQLRYEGPAGVTGYMSFQRGGGRYSLTTQFNIPFYKMAFETTGLIEGKFFKPLQYTDRRKGKVYAQAIFDYDNQEIRYGRGAEPDQVEPLTHHAQDFFTLAWQMALNGGKLSEPMQVTNGKKVYLHSDFSPKGDRQYDSNEGKINVQVFRINRGEDGIEFAFAPDFANIPAQIILTDGGKTYQLRLIGITLDGVDYWQAIRRTRDR
ncbi:MAG: hypothetical protein KBC57_00420 [Neisseriaceae bacterium]|nr:hypothetical protein [Neisseriaceae bacterium]